MPSTLNWRITHTSDGRSVIALQLAHERIVHNFIVARDFSAFAHIHLFKIDIETCEHCGGAAKVIASIEDPVVIKRILAHLARRAEAATPVFRSFARAPPQPELRGLKEPG